jgi:iron-sulfur cluster repair protein YtfE (RIC family)
MRLSPTSVRKTGSLPIEAKALQWRPMRSPDQTALWREHPNADGPALMLLSIHDQFRAASTHLVRLVAEDQSPAVFRRVFSRLAHVLHAHHHAEEAMVFPLIRRRTGVAPEQLQADHDELTAAIEAVETSLGAQDSARVGEAIKRFDEILVAHLDREEELVIPVFLQLQPHELWRQLHS